jgi:hypothetical protein
MSDVMMAGTSNLQIHPESNAAAAVLAREVPPAARSIHDSQNLIKTIGGCERAYQVDVDVGKAALRDWDLLLLDLKMGMDL